MIIRELVKGEIENIWKIDRNEVIEKRYYLREGRLALEAEHYDMRGWPPGEAKLYTAILCNCFDWGGTFAL